MGLLQRSPHDTFVILCDICGAASSDSTSSEVEATAILEGFTKSSRGLWVCERVDEVHDRLREAR